MTNSPFISKVFQTLDDKDLRKNKNALILGGVLLLIWLGLVIFTEFQHEFWRDEIRALSLVQMANSPLDLFKLIQYEGHPFLWYAILYIGSLIFQSNLILPVFSILIGFAAVTLLMLYAPLPLWWKTIFIFSAIPLYEYTVMARNYGISMLLLFIFALLYTRKSPSPYWLAGILFLLANTNVHSLILTGLILLIWAFEFYTEKAIPPIKKQIGMLFLPFMIVLAGMVLSVFVVFPKHNTILVNENSYIGLSTIFEALKTSILQPSSLFGDLFPGFIPGWLISLLLTICILGFIRKPQYLLAALGAQVGLGLAFILFYSGKFRHQGLYLVFLVFLLWLFTDKIKDNKLAKPFKIFQLAGFTALTILILGNLTLIKNTLIRDINTPASASKEFGAFLNTSETYQNAIILPEPDFFMESLPYYADNPIFFIRENRFGLFTQWDENMQRNLSLVNLLDTAQELEAEYNQPVLIVIGHWDIDLNASGEVIYSYNKYFTWEKDEAAAFLQATESVAEFTPAFTGEKYRVYALK